MYNMDTIFNKNFDKFQLIFDAAAIGQYVGGEISRKKPGFVSKECVINYSNFVIKWINEDPFIVIDEELIEIACLHIHSKELYKYIII